MNPPETVQWSFSGMKQLVNCPHQYHEVRIAKNFVQEDTDATMYGKEVHKALELYIAEGAPLSENYQRFEKLIGPLKAMPGQKYCELQMGLLADRLTACKFDDPNYWVHGIADLVIVDDEQAWIIDYKTGKSRYADTKQLKLMALMVFAKFPKVERIAGGLLFLLDEQFITEFYTRGEIKALWESFDQPLRLMYTYHTQNLWPKNPSGLCRRYCPVETCEHHRS